MNLEPLGQHNTGWAGQRLGTGVYDGARLLNVTIGGYGCTITCITMANRAFNPGDNRMPNHIDDIFTNQGGYVNGKSGNQFRRSPALGCDLVDWNMVNRLLPNCAYAARANYPDGVPADLARIKAHIDAGGLVILQVYWGGNKSKMHFVLAVAYNGNDIIVNDPEKGDRATFSSRRFGSGNSANDIYAAHFFIDGVPNPAPAPVPPAPPAPSPSTNEPGRGSGPVEAPAPVPAPVIEPPKEEEVTQLEHDQAIAVLTNQYETKLAEERERTAVAVEVAQKQGKTITTLTEELNKHVPEYERTEKPDAGEYLTTAEHTLIDFSDRKPPVEAEANLIVDAASRFIVAGLEYIRSQPSKDNGDWFGYDVRFLTPYQPLNPAPIAAPARPPLNSSQRVAAAVVDGMSFWEKLVKNIKFWRTH